MKHKTFIKNAAIMTVTALILRTIGIFFRIYMSNKIGAEGMGLYQLIFSIYVLGSTFATAGISTAVTRMITDELVCGTKKSVLHILRRAMLISVLIGTASMLLIYFLADPISQYWIKDMRAAPALKILCPSLPCMGISSCLRGYFMARRRVSWSSNAQIVDQLVRIGIVMFLIDRFSAMGIAYACAAVMIGDTLAEFASCLYMAIGYFRDRRRLETHTQRPPRLVKGVFRRLMSIAAPITAGRYLNTVLRTIENILVPDKLTDYTGSKTLSLSQFGMLKGMAMPLLFFPSSFLSTLSTLLIPEISEAHTLGKTAKVERMVNHTLHITLTLSILISGIFLLFSREIGLLVYQSEEVGFFMLVLAPLMPAMYVESVVDGILKGMNQQGSSLRYSVLDSAVRIILIFVIVPLRGMEGFLFVMVVSNLLTAGLNIRRLLKVTGVRIRWGQWIFKPGLAMATAGALSMLCTRFLPLQGLLLTCISAALAVIVYAVLLSALGCVTREDLHLIKN